MFSFTRFVNLLEEEELLSEAISSNDKGVLHELLTGKHLHQLIGHTDEHGEGHHMSPEAKTKHDEIKSRITKEEYDDHAKIAHGTAVKIHQHAEGNVKSVHWTSKPGDIGRLTGHDESQQENPSDIMVKHHDGSHTGYSLKVTQKKHGKVPVGNPGANQTDSQLGSDATKHYDNAKKEFLEKHKELEGKTTSEKKEIIKKNPALLKEANEKSNKAIGKIRDDWHDKLQKMDKQKLSDHIRHNLLHANHSKTKMYKVTSGGKGDDHSVEIEHPATHHDHILNHPEGISVRKSGNNSIEYVHSHDGKVFMRHRIKPESTPLVTSLKGSIE